MARGHGLFPVLLFMREKQLSKNAYQGTLNGSFYICSKVQSIHGLEEGKPKKEHKKFNEKLTVS